MKAPLTRLPLLAALTAAVFATSHQAQTLTRSGGVLGASSDYSLFGDPGEFWILLPSLLPGPTPLSLIDPGDTRSLAVGLDQVSLWTGGFLDGAGAASQSYALPSDPSLQGVSIYAQFVTYPGNPFKVDDISNGTGVVLGASGSATAPIAQPSSAWAGHGTTLLADGRVLRSGGTHDVGGTSVAVTSLETWDPQSGTWTTSGAVMGQERAAHTATLLLDGRVLLVGGADTAGVISATCDLFDPLADTISAAASMGTARTQHTATLLADGRVLVVGGTNSIDPNDPLASLGSIVGTAEVYDPNLNTWTSVGSLPKPRLLHSASLLADGRVLVTGGLEVTSIFGIPFGNLTNDARLFNPATGTFQNASNFGGNRLGHPQLTLSDGRVLVAGGTDGDLLTQVFTPRSDVWVFDPSSNAWSQAPSLARARAFGSLVESGADILLLQGLETLDLATLTGVPVLEVDRTDLGLGPWTTAGTSLAAHPLSGSVVVDGDTRVLTVGAGDDLVTDSELFIR